MSSTCIPARTGPADPYPLYRQLLGAGPVRGGPDGAWYVFGYQACRRALGDRGCRVPAGHQTAGRLQASMVMHDPPEHARLRRAISWAFTPAEVHRLCDRIVALTDRAFDAVVVLGAGNRDPVRFDDPARFCPGRPDNVALSFGWVCTGVSARTWRA